MVDKSTPGHPQPSITFAQKAATSAQPSPLALSYSSLPCLHPRRSTTMPMAAALHASDGSLTSMAPPPPRALAMDHKKKLDINSLMSPPDAALDCFAHAMDGTAGKMDPARGPPASALQPLPMSPPVSPYSRSLGTPTAQPVSPPPSQQVKDPVLYPVVYDTLRPSPPQPPLFAPAELEHRRIVDEHVRSRPQSIFAGQTPPRREDYELVLTFRSQVMKGYISDPKAWLRKERAFLEADRRAGHQPYHAIMPAKPLSLRLPRSQRADRVTKSQPGGAQRQGRKATPPPRVARPAGRVSTTPEPSRRLVAPNREDKDFGVLPDYCPPLESLPDRPNSLKVDWKGQPIDLSNDVHVHLLHPHEVLLASNLRLDCATYLTSKRRIFERRLQCIAIPKEFRKTDAQQACKIDVNKASKLWTAFERVGWLDQSWFRKYL